MEFGKFEATNSLMYIAYTPREQNVLIEILIFFVS